MDFLESIVCGDFFYCKNLNILFLISKPFKIYGYGIFTVHLVEIDVLE